MSNTCQHKTNILANLKHFVLPSAIRSKLEIHPIGQLLYISNIGYFNKRGLYKTSDLILIFCLDGKNSIEVDDQTITLQANECCLIEANTSISYIPQSKSSYTLGWIKFNGRKANELCSNISLRQKISLQDQGRNMFHDFLNIIEGKIGIDRVLHIIMQLWSFLSALSYAPAYANIGDIDRKRIDSSIPQNSNKNDSRQNRE